MRLDTKRYIGRRRRVYCQFLMPFAANNLSIACDRDKVRVEVTLYSQLGQHLAHCEDLGAVDFTKLLTLSTAGNNTGP